MLKLEDITTNTAVSGIEPGQVVRVVTTEPVGENALTVYYCLIPLKMTGKSNSI